MSTERHSRRTSRDRGCSSRGSGAPIVAVIPTLGTKESGLPVQGEDGACRSLYAAAKEEVGTTDAGRLPGREPGFAPGPSNSGAITRGGAITGRCEAPTESMSNVASQRPPDQRLTGPCSCAAPLEPGAARRAMEPRQPAPHARSGNDQTGTLLPRSTTARCRGRSAPSADFGRLDLASIPRAPVFSAAPSHSALSCGGQCGQATAATRSQAPANLSR
jgi:hypothetical protein